MKVALLAMTARGSMAHYLDGLAPPLSKLVDLRLVAPEHYVRSMDDDIEAVGFRAPDARMRRALTLGNPLGADVVWQPIANDRPDVIHIFNASGFPWATVVARRARRAGIPTIATMHDPVGHPGDYWRVVNTVARNITWRTATARHVHGEVWRDVALRRGYPAASLYVIPHGSFGPQFLRHRTPGVEREPLVVFFGRVERYKGIETLAAATPLFPPPLRTVIAGPGHLRRRERRAIASHPNRFELRIGYHSDADVARLFQRASVCVLPYIQATQSSIPLIAAAFGVPVVASAVGAFVEDVPRVGGVLVPPGDPRALADGVARALDSRAIDPPEMGFDALAVRFAEMYERVRLS